MDTGSRKQDGFRNKRRNPEYWYWSPMVRYDTETVIFFPFRKRKSNHKFPYDFWYPTDQPQQGVGWGVRDKGPQESLLYGHSHKEIPLVSGVSVDPRREQNKIKIKIHKGFIPWSIFFLV